MTGGASGIELATLERLLAEGSAAANTLSRFGEPAEVAWMLSDESSHVTGGVYVLDGGEEA